MLNDSSTSGRMKRARSVCVAMDWWRCSQHQPTPANSQELAMHYSFDFAQQVHYPSNAAQPGPMCFMSARKCAIFGVCCEGFLKQVNYLVNECQLQQGLHHFFESFGFGEKTVHCIATTVQGRTRTYMFCGISCDV